MDSNIYHEELMEHFKNSTHRGVLESPDLVSEEYNPSCGDRIKITGKVVNGVIADMKISGSGCVISQASASMLAEFLIGKPVDSVLELSGDDIAKMLKISLGPTRTRCATLGLSAVKDAVEKFLRSHEKTKEKG